MFARALAFVLVRFAPTVTLARLERAIIQEVLARRAAAREGRASPAQRWMPRCLVRYQIRRATRHLHRTVEGWKWSSGK